MVVYYYLIQLDNAKTSEEIDNIVDNPIYAGIINSSGWPITRAITPHTKDTFICNLVEFAKRKSPILALKKGLSLLGVDVVVLQNKELMRPVFIYNEIPLTAITVISMIDLRERGSWTPDCCKAYEFFVQYLQARENGMTFCSTLLHY